MPPTPQEQEISRFRQRLLAHVDYNVPGSYEAFLVAYNAIHGLITKNTDGLERANLRWARMCGFRDANSDAAVIVQIEWHVRTALDIRRGDGTFGDPKEAVPNLHEALLARFPKSKSIPNEAELADWLDRYVPNKRSGMLTITGIVAKIVHSGRLLGAQKSHEQTLQRVTKALDRKRHPRW